VNIPVFTAHPQGAGDELPEVVDHPASADAEIIKIAVEEVARRDHGLDEFDRIFDAHWIAMHIGAGFEPHR